jgi:ABC-type Na+ transport system ATPase subunit NatA
VMSTVSSDSSIIAHNLVKKYGSVTALDGLNLEVRTGSVLGLLGPNGAGKTTAVSILTTLVKPTSGSATVAGVDVLAHPCVLHTTTPVYVWSVSFPSSQPRSCGVIHLVVEEPISGGEDN